MSDLTMDDVGFLKERVQEQGGVLKSHSDDLTDLKIQSKLSVDSLSRIEKSQNELVEIMKFQSTQIEKNKSFEKIDNNHEERIKQLEKDTLSNSKKIMKVTLYVAGFSALLWKFAPFVVKALF